MLEWVALSFSRGSSGPRDRTGICCIGRRILNPWASWEAWSHGRVVIFLMLLQEECGVRTNLATETTGNVLEAECFEKLTCSWKKRQKHRDCFLAHLPGSSVDSLADWYCAILAVTIKRSATSWRQSWHCLANKQGQKLPAYGFIDIEALKSCFLLLTVERNSNDTVRVRERRKAEIEAEPWVSPPFGVWEGHGASHVMCTLEMFVVLNWFKRVRQATVSATLNIYYATAGPFSFAPIPEKTASPPA